MHDSPCSVPDWLRALIPLETEAQQAVCRLHDYEYGRGGTHAERLACDIRFAANLLAAGMAPESVEQYFWGVRQYGGLAWHGGDFQGSAPLTQPLSVEAP